MILGVDLKPISFSVWSSLQIPSDQFDANIIGIERYENANRADRVDLTTGFLDSAGNPHTIGKLKKGIIQEYVIQAAASKGKVEYSAQVRGFDQAALMLETKYNMRYLHFPVAASISASAEVEDPSNPYYIPKVVGIFSASQVARDAAAAAGLTLRWECPDYTLNEDFVAQGRAIDTVYSLVRPYQITEPFKVDVLLMGDVLLCKQRDPNATADPSTGVFSIHDARIQSLNVRRKRALKYGRVRLRGCLKIVNDGSGFGATTDPVTGGLVFVAGEDTKETSRTTGLSTGTTTVVVERVTYRMPDQIVTHVEKRTFANDKEIAREVTDNDWEASVYSLQGPVNQPKQRGAETTWSGLTGNPPKLKEIKVEKTEMSYDADSFLKAMSKTTRVLDTSTNKMTNSELVVSTYRDEGPLWIRQTTETSRWDKKTNLWKLQSIVEQISGGHRPGGPGRGLGTGYHLPGAGGLKGQQTVSEVTAVLSTDLDAVDIDESFPQMDEAALGVVLDRIKRAHNMAEFEANIQAVAIPWMGRGEVIEFTGFVDDQAAPITLQPLLIHELRADYTGGKNIALTSKMKGIFWKSEKV